MIIDLKYFKDNGYFIGFLSFAKDFVQNKFYAKKNKVDWFEARLEGVSLFPRLILDENNKTSCDSCSQCISICPTQALRVEGEEGLAPKIFELKINQCISCNLCIEICPSEALILGNMPASHEFYKKQVLSKDQLYLNFQKTAQNINL